jgi:group I intron endonuclease
MGIIYCYTNKKTDKKYIGQTIHPEQRKRNHIHEAFVRDSDYYFHRSLRKHGLESFKYEILEETDDLNNRENYYIETLNTLWPYGYNQTYASTNSVLHRKKISEGKKAKFAAMSPEERRASVEPMVQANIGSKKNEETRRKMSESMKKYLAENPRPKRVWTDEMKAEQSRRLKEKYAQGIGRWAK